MGQIKANIKPEYTIKENERYAWVWRCVRLTTIPGQSRQDVREWNYVAFNKRDHLRFRDNFKAANVHEAFLIHDGERERADNIEREKIEREKAETIRIAKERAEKEEAKKKAVVKKAKTRAKSKKPAK